MSLQDRLAAVIDEYLTEVDKLTIGRISILVPGNDGNFFIMDSFKLNLKPKEIFTLAILFGCGCRSKQELELISKIENAGCLNSFTSSRDNRNITYVKETNNNKQDIIESVELIIKTVFPLVETDKVDAALIRINDCHSLKR